MPKKLYPVHLRAKERAQLEGYVKHGQKSARAMNRARILLLADAQHSDEEIVETLGVSRQTVDKVRKTYSERKGSKIVELLQEKPRPGQPVKVDSRVVSHVSLIACSEVPEGAARWTLQMIADRLVELTVVEALWVESVRRALKKTTSNPGLPSGGV